MLGVGVFTADALEFDDDWAMSTENRSFSDDSSLFLCVAWKSEYNTKRLADLPSSSIGWIWLNDGDDGDNLVARRQQRSDFESSRRPCVVVVKWNVMRLMMIWDGVCAANVPVIRCNFLLLVFGCWSTNTN